MRITSFVLVLAIVMAMKIMVQMMEMNFDYVFKLHSKDRL